MADTQPITSEAKAPYKRKMTDKRRDQNRAAQKLYRVFPSSLNCTSKSILISAQENGAKSV
jgi:hypothetical protein